MMSSNSPRAMRMPRSTSKLPSMLGSLISPFQPMVARGFSKYTRITIFSRSAYPAAISASRRA